MWCESICFEPKEGWFLVSGSVISGDAGEMVVSVPNIDAGIGRDKRFRLHKFWRDSARRFKGLLGLNMYDSFLSRDFPSRPTHPTTCRSRCSAIRCCGQFEALRPILFSVMMEKLRNTWKSNSICRLISQKPTGKWRSSSAIGWRTTPCTRGPPSTVFVLSL